VCINEAALLAAGLPYREVLNVDDLPPCFSRPIAAFVLSLNDYMPDEERQRLMPFVTRLSGSADDFVVEVERTRLLALRAVTHFAPRALDAVELDVSACRRARTLRQAQIASSEAREAVLRQSIEWAFGGRWHGDLTIAERAIGSANAAVIWANTMLPDSIEEAIHAAVVAVCMPQAWDEALEALDDALLIGRQAEPMPLAAERLARVVVAA